MNRTSIYYTAFRELNSYIFSKGKLAHWVLLISLVGLFLLTAAMALPDMQHSIEQSHAPVQQRLADTSKIALQVDLSNTA